jgi:hypothetical protein
MADDKKTTQGPVSNQTDGYAGAPIVPLPSIVSGSLGSGATSSYVDSLQNPKPHGSPATTFADEVKARGESWSSREATTSEHGPSKQRSS